MLLRGGLARQKKRTRASSRRRTEARCRGGRRKILVVANAGYEDPTAYSYFLRFHLHLDLPRVASSNGRPLSLTFSYFPSPFSALSFYPSSPIHPIHPPQPRCFFLVLFLPLTPSGALFHSSSLCFVYPVICACSAVLSSSFLPPFFSAFRRRPFFILPGLRARLLIPPRSTLLHPCVQDRACVPPLHRSAPVINTRRPLNVSTAISRIKRPPRRSGPVLRVPRVYYSLPAAFSRR